LTGVLSWLESWIGGCWVGTFRWPGQKLPIMGNRTVLFVSWQ